MATRISLIQSVKHREQREQIGNIPTPFVTGLTDIEKRCLIRLSEAARSSSHQQVALNSIIRAQQLEKIPSFDISQEFASVLWMQKEQKLAVEFLRDLMLREDPEYARPTVDASINGRRAHLLAQLVRPLSRRPFDIDY
jgi:ataxia telangiectasia mutated family protein